MAVRFKMASAVAVGTMNIYVIQPKWLVEVGLLPADSKIRMESDLNRPGFRYTTEESSLKWDVRPERLMIHSESAYTDCGTVLADVLGKLPWTPLLAVGFNFEFQGDIDEVARIAKELRPPSCIAPSTYAIKQTTSHIAIQQGDQIFNFQMAAADHFELAINVHTDVNNKGTQETISRCSIDACRRFVEFRQKSRELAESLLKLELKDE